MRRLVTLLLALLLAACTSVEPAPAPAVPPIPSSSPPSPALTPSGVTPSSPTPDPVPALELTVMTYNIMGINPPRRWFPLSSPKKLKAAARVEPALALIGQADADILGLQEFRPGTAAGRRLAAGLDGYGWAAEGAPSATSPREQVAIPVLYRSSRFTLLDSGSRRLSQRGHDGAYMDRYVAWARLRERTTDRELLVFNYHAHPRQGKRYARVRSDAVRQLLEVIAEVDPDRTTPIVVLGDFNARSNETRTLYRDHIDRFALNGIVDAAAIAQADTSDIPGADSHNRLSAPVAGRDVANVVRRNGRHIDYVWVPIRTEVLSWATLSGPGVEWRTVRGEKVPVWTGTVASDHSPVVARLRFAGLR